MMRDLPPDPVRWAAGRWPDRPAFDGPTGAFTFADLDRALDRATGALAARGIRRRMRVLTNVTDPRQHATLLLAVMRLGGVAVPLSAKLPAAGVDVVAARVGISARIGDGDPVLDEIATVAGGPSSPPAPLPAGARRRATILLTSGSGGRPKPVVHRLSAHLLSALHASEHLGLCSGDRWLATLPLHHVGGLAPVFRTLVSGATWVAAGEALSAKSLRFSGATHVSVVSTQLQRLVDAGEPPPESLRCVLLGGGPVHPDVVRGAVSRGWPVVASYGMTETASMVAATGVGDPDPTTVGRALGHARLKTGRSGEILVRCRSLAEGVLEGAGVAPLVDRNGWYRTGDRGTIDPDGRLRVEGRLDRRFVSGGENVQPEEIERRLVAIAGVRSAVVVSVPDREFGRRPVAFVDGTVPPDVLRAELRRWLPPYLVPVRFLPMPGEVEQGGIKASPARLQEIAARMTEEP